MKKIFFCLVCLVLILFWGTVNVHAESRFLTKYNVSYDVGGDGVTTVDEGITFRNTTDQFYVSKFSLTIGATKITDISASDVSGPLPTQVTTEGNRTKIEVSFTKQIVGIDKEYTWHLKYRSRDYAERQGKVWQVTIPRAPKLEAGDEYKLSVSVPVSFGDPTSINPNPVSKIEQGGKIRMYFDASELVQRGILASFGSSQIMSFDIKYEIKNNNVLPAYGKLALPMDTGYQQVLINELNPRPENVVVDNDGNYIAWYKLERDQVLNVVAKGLVKLNLKSSGLPKVELSKYDVNRLTKSDKYWEVDNPIIKQRLKEILGSDKDLSVRDKARLIDKFVVNFLTYNQDRVTQGNFDRLGAIAALNNPTQALCGEYTDLFVTLARAAGIPARRLEGFAYTSNREIRPLSLGKTLLHAWPEYYDPVRGWVMIDPTWESSNDGVDYFNSFDLNHIVLAIEGESSIQPSASGDVSVTITDTDFLPRPEGRLEISSSNVVLAGLPVVIGTKVLNNGNTVLPEGRLELSADGLGELETNNFHVDKIPPYGYFDVQTRLQPATIWVNHTGDLGASFSGVLVKKKLELKPFYEYHLIFGLAAGSLVLMLGVYGFSLYLHVKSQNRNSNKEKKSATKVHKPQ